MPQPSLPKALAPWSLKGQAYCFVHGTRVPSAVPEHNEDPEASSRPLMGGLGGVVLFRYATSPVGAYDELLIVPGAYGYQQPMHQPRGFGSFGSLSQLALRLLSRGTLPGTLRSHQRQLSERSFGISQIYVSTEASTIGGRQNWSIPKKQAVFDWQQDPKTGATHISLSLPVHHRNSNHMLAAKRQEAQKPFLTASFKSVTPHVWMPKFVVPSIFRRILQPALPEQVHLFNGEADSVDGNAPKLLPRGGNEDHGFNRFVSTKLDVDARIGLCKLNHLWTDGVEVPACDAIEPIRIGCSLKKVNLTFNVPDVYWLASMFNKNALKSA